MKFAILDNLICYGQQRNGQPLEVNIGDSIQWIAIKYLYEYIGIDDKDIVHLGAADLKIYQGESLILPINFVLTEGNRAIIGLDDENGISKDIIPVFLGISIKKGFWHWSDAYVNYLKKFAPIGCRDYYTYQTLQEHGIESYLSGCLTMCFPKRKDNNKDRVYFVEVPEEVREYVPKWMFKNCKFVYHVVKVQSEDYYSKEYVMDLARNRLQEYKENAKVVITSRLHCALPCLAMGIPVILIKEYMGYPFDLVPKFLPFYTLRDLAHIDWNPQTVDIEAYKRKALSVAEKQIRNMYNRYFYRNLHDEYIDLYRDKYVLQEMPFDMVYKTLNARYHKDSLFRYAVWGASHNADIICEYISTHYPNARLVKVIDRYKKGIYKNIMIDTPDVLQKHDDFVTLVTTLNCMAEAKQRFCFLKKDKQEYIYISKGAMVNSVGVIGE